MLKTSRLAIIFGAAMIMQPAPIAADPVQNGNPKEVKAAIRAIYKNFNDRNKDTAYWELPVYSKATSQLISKWKSAPDQQDNISDLEGGDWLCSCQDFDEKKLKPVAFTFAPRGLSETHAKVTVRLDLGTSEQRDIYLSLNKEQGRWVIADIERENGGVSFQKQLLTEIEKGR